MDNYKTQFYNKIVFCNCDDPQESNFFKYFILNFNALQLKSLVVTGCELLPRKRGSSSLKNKNLIQM